MITAEDVAEAKPMSKYAKEFGVARATIQRWVTVGCKGIQLRAIVLGSRILVKQSDWDNFMTAVNDARLNPDPDARMNPDLEKSDKIDKEVKRTDRERRESVKAARAKINNTNKRKAG